MVCVINVVPEDEAKAEIWEKIPRTCFAKFNMPHRSNYFLLYALIRDLFLKEDVFDKVYTTFMDIKQGGVYTIMQFTTSEVGVMD